MLRDRRSRYHGAADTPTYSLTFEQADGALVLRLGGRLDRNDAPALFEQSMNVMDTHPHDTIRLDLSEVTYLDGAGVSVFLALEHRAHDRGQRFVIENVSPDAAGYLNLVDRETFERCSDPFRRPRTGLIVRLGNATVRHFNQIVFEVSFAGHLILALVHSLRHPAKVRWGDTVRFMEYVGVDALPIVGLISFLVGLVMGFQGVVTLQPYGVGVLLANLVALVMVQELGPFMTAIIVAGRSGSAFASEIGTMKISEELDAVSTMGLNPYRFTAVPKLLATMAVMPFLALFSDITGIFGSMLVGVSLMNVSFGGYVDQTFTSVGMWDLIHGSIKSVIFAVLISSIGCLRGLQTEGGAEGVGRQTTSAVVSGIFLVVLADATYRVALQAWG